MPVPPVLAARRPTPGEPAGAGRARSLVPGLALVAGATGLAEAVAALVPGLNPSTVAVVLGALAVNTGLLRPALRPGTGFAARRLLRVSVVLLGLQIPLRTLAGLGARGLLVVAATVAVTFTGTQLLGRALGVAPGRSLLVATGFSICGASAVAAMAQATDADEDDAAVAVALVTLCGSLAIVVLPPLAGPLGLGPVAFGRWVGASVHDVGQTVATAQRVPGSLQAAVVVKLTRVALLAPLVAGVAVTRRRRAAAAAAARAVAPAADDAVPGRRPPVVPVFVTGFLVAVLATSTGWLPAPLLAAARAVQQVLLVAALVGLGAGIHVAVLRRTGGRALVLGLASWVLVAGVALAGVRLLGG